MPANLSNLSANHARLDRDFGNGQTLFIEYRPALITPRQLHRLQALQGRAWDTLSTGEQNELMDSTTQMLADCVIAWDLLDANDQPIPSTLEGLQDVDYVSQAALLQMITEDQQQSKPTGSEPSPVSFTDISVSRPIFNALMCCLPS